MTTYAVMLRLHERGAKQLRDETGSKLLEDAEAVEQFEADDLDEATQMAEEYGRVLMIGAVSPAPKMADANGALIECDAAAIRATYARPMGVELAEARRSQPAHGSQLVLLAEAEDRPTPVRDALTLAAIWTVGVAVVTAVSLGQFARRVARPFHHARRRRLRRL
jgi:uncharacterized protein with GYD domain